MFLTLQYSYFRCAIIPVCTGNLRISTDSVLLNNRTTQRGKGFLGIHVSVNKTIDGINIKTCPQEKLSACPPLGVHPPTRASSSSPPHPHLPASTPSASIAAVSEIHTCTNLFYYVELFHSSNSIHL